MALANVYAKNYSNRRHAAEVETYKLILFPADNSIAVVKSKQCSPAEHDGFLLVQSGKKRFSGVALEEGKATFFRRANDENFRSSRVQYEPRELALCTQPYFLPSFLFAWSRALFVRHKIKPMSRERLPKHMSVCAGFPSSTHASSLLRRLLWKWNRISKLQFVLRNPRTMQQSRRSNDEEACESGD